MRLHRHSSFPLCLLIPILLATSLTVIGDEKPSGPDIDDLNRNELNNNVDEPQIDLPEVRNRPNPFRNVSQGVRKESRDPLVRLSQNAVDTTARRLLSTDQHTPWQMMHALLGLRHDFALQHEGQTISGLDWISEGQSFDNEYWFEKTSFGGRAHVYNRPYAFEGHANQFVAILSMCGVALDHEFGTQNGSITMRSMIEHAKMSLDTKKDEPTWTLWALSRYLPPNARWRNAEGEMWSIERLVQDQTARPMKGAPCGGTHSLFALAHARNVYQQQGKPLRGVWLQAEYKIRKYINTARQLQNSNGTLSSNYFRGREYNPDFNKRMASAGHVLEFLMIALPQRELSALWVRRAIEATAQDLMNNRKAYVKCSPLYHSVNALNIYLDRVNPRSRSNIAAANKQPRTAMATPKTLREPSGELKGVPAIGIAQSRELPTIDATEGEGVATISPKAIESKTAEVQLPEPIADEAAKPRVAEKGDQIVDVPVLAKKSMQGAINRDKEKWASTPPDRQSPITVPESKVNVAIIETTEKATQNEGSAEVESVETATDTDKSDVVEQRQGASTTRIAPLITPGAESDKTVETPQVPVEKTLVTDEEADKDEAKADKAGTVDAETDKADAVDAKTEEADAVDAETDKAAAIEAKTDEAAAVDAETGKAAAVDAKTDKADAVDAETGKAYVDDAETDKADAAESSEAEQATDESASETLPIDDDAADVEASKPGETTATAGVPVKSVSTSRVLDVPATTETSVTVSSTQNRATVRQDINSEFLSTDLNPSEWVQRFESQTREVASERAAIVAAIGVRYGQWIADVGAGTGLFLRPLSYTVGRRGRVFAVDISPRLVEHLERRVAEERISNVQVVRNDGHSLGLAGRRIHKALLCDTYHHFEHPQEMLASIFESLQPGGELILVDFERVPGKSREWVLQLVRADKQTFRSEIEAAGFQYVEEISIPGFSEHYFLRFRRPRK